MSLATSVNNQPWVCEVHFAYDDDLNLYFISKPSRRHSHEIAQNPNVAGNIVKQHGQGQKPRGVYFEGTAELLSNITKDSPAYKLYNERFGISDKTYDEITNQPDGHKFYKITPKNFVLFDAVNFPENARQEWRL